MPRFPHPVDVHVGARISARRTAIGLSQVVLAERLGISAQQVQKYEAGTNRISASRLNEVARTLGLAPGAFFPDAGAGPEGRDPGPDAGLRFMTATAEGRAVAADFPLIEDRVVRKALATIVGALTPG